RNRPKPVPPAPAPVPPHAGDVTPWVRVVLGRARYNSRTRQYERTVTLVNESGRTLAGPLAVVFEVLDRSNGRRRGPARAARGGGDRGRGGAGGVGDGDGFLILDGVGHGANGNAGGRGRMTCRSRRLSVQQPGAAGGADEAGVAAERRVKDLRLLRRHRERQPF